MAPDWLFFCSISWISIIRHSPNLWSQIRDKIGVSSRRAVTPVCLVVYQVRRVDFRGRLVVNCSYSSRRDRVRLVDSPDRVVVLVFDSWLPSSSRRLPRSSRRSSVRLVAAAFVSSTLQIESSFFCSTRGCRVRLVDPRGRLVVRFRPIETGFQ